MVRFDEDTEKDTGQAMNERVRRTEIEKERETSERERTSGRERGREKLTPTKHHNHRSVYDISTCGKVCWTHKGSSTALLLPIR